jgi:hypothetical protein
MANLAEPLRTASARPPAAITASAMGTTQNDTSILTRFWPPVRWNAAHALSMAERDGLKIPEGGSPVV